VRAHLARHARGSADMSDLVASLVESSGRAELGGIMKTFTELPGTPLVDVQLRCGAQEQPTVTLSQRRYLPAGSKADAQQKWDIPVCMRIGVVDGVREQCAVLSEPTMDVVLDGVDGCPNWVMPNRGGRGYYRWHLDETRLARHPLWFSSAKAQRELGYTWRPAEQAIAEAVSWFQGVT